MKKFALLPIAALMLATASCSDDNNEPVRPAVPTDPVVTVESVADQVTLNVPEQFPEFEYDSKAGVYKFKYANGQEISFYLANNANYGNIATVRGFGGASEIVIPASLTAVSSAGETQIYKIVGLDLYQDGVQPGVKKLTISKDVNGIYQNMNITQVTDAWLRFQIEKMPDLENLELENGYPGFCSIGGAIYTSDYKTLVSVPRAKTGVFTIAEKTQIVGERALYYCSKLTGITFPEAITEIKANAVTFNDMLVLINMEGKNAPLTYEDSFGKMAQTSLLRIPVGSKDSYFPAKPEMEEPVAPIDPGMSASDEEYAQYEVALAKYEADLAAYNKAMEIYNFPAGFRNFQNVEEVNFD